MNLYFQLELAAYRQQKNEEFCKKIEERHGLTDNRNTAEADLPGDSDSSGKIRMDKHGLDTQSLHRGSGKGNKTTNGGEE